MADTGIKAIITVEAPGAQATFNQLAGGAARTEAAFKKAIPPVSQLGNSIETLRAKALARGDFLIRETDLSKIAQYNKEIIALKAEMTRLQNVGKTGFNAMGQAATASTNLIVSGSQKAFTALRSVAYVLPGVGIAGIIGFATTFIANMFDIGQEADETAKKIKELLKPIEDLKAAAAGGAQGDIALVQALTAVVLDQTKSYVQRNNALNQLKGINKAYYDDMTLEAASLKLLKERTNEYTKALIQQAVIKAFSDQIGKLAVELVEQEKAYNKTGHELDKYNKKLAGAKKEAEALGLPFLSLAAPETLYGLATATKEFNKQAGVIGKLHDRMFDFRNEMARAVEESTKLLSLDEIEIPDVKPDPDKAWKKQIQDHLDRMKFIVNAPVELIIPEQAPFEIRPEDPDISKRLFPMGVDARSIKAAMDQTKALEEYFARQQEKMRAEAKKTADMIGGALSGAVNSFIDAIIAGENPIKAFFKALQQAILQVIKDLIAAAIKAFILRLIISGVSGGAGAAIGGGGMGGGWGGRIANPGRAGGLIGAARPINVIMSGQMTARGGDLVYVFNQTQRRQGRAG